MSTQQPKFKPGDRIKPNQDLLEGRARAHGFIVAIEIDELVDKVSYKINWTHDGSIFGMHPADVIDTFYKKITTTKGE